MGAKKAVLVGINAYPAAPLQGCINDVIFAKLVLIKRFGFVESDIKTLMDSEATTEAVVAALKWLVFEAKPGDILYFHYSGHGVQVPVSRSIEIDGLSEAICPVDFDWSPEKMITDKQFMDIFSTIPIGVQFNWVSDSCHSGDLDRSLEQDKWWHAWKWFKPAVKHPLIRPRTMPIPGWVRKAMTSNKSWVRPRAVLSGQVVSGFVSGCKSNQTSADTIVDGRAGGALTSYLFKRLNEGQGSLPLSLVVKMVGDDLSRDGYEQNPQIEGLLKDKPFLYGSISL